MGGEGSMQAMNTILRNNRNLLRPKKLFDKNVNTNYVPKTRLAFPTKSTKDLEIIKDNFSCYFINS